MKLVVTGSIGIDSVETPDGERREELLGGSCTYFSAAASFHGPVRIVGVVGEDFPAAHRAVFDAFGVDTEGLEVRRGGKTFRWSGKYRANMDERDTLSTDLNVLGEAPPRAPAAYADSEFVFLANAPPAVQLGFLEQFPNRKLVVADTMDLWIETAKDDLLKLMKAVDGLVLNYDEAELFTGKRNTVAAARHLLELGPSFVVVKKGEHGCIFAHEEGIAALPAYPAEEVVDPTGAGDSFAGGMMGFLAAHGDFSFRSLLASLAHGTVMASFTIEEFSLGRLSTLTKEELSARFAGFSGMLRF